MRLTFGIFKKLGKITKAVKVGEDVRCTISVDGGGEAVVDLSPDDVKAINNAKPPVAEIAKK